MHCRHCEVAVKEELGAVTGVDAIDVDLAAKTVSVQGRALDDEALRVAIDEAGYEAA
jgi:copper chaperone CopZ